MEGIYLIILIIWSIIACIETAFFNNWHEMELPLNVPHPEMTFVLTEVSNAEPVIMENNPITITQNDDRKVSEVAFNMLPFEIKM